MDKTIGERKVWPPEQDQRGLACRQCGCKHFRVIYTQPAWGGEGLCAGGSAATAANGSQRGNYSIDIRMLGSVFVALVIATEHPWARR